MKQGPCSLTAHRAEPTTGQRSTQVERHAQILQYLDMAEPLGFDTVVAG